jgi:FlaA1/EpsC-like NDP-sugar epimerase
VDIADLLGRDSVPAQEDLLERCIKGKTVMVTGAGGSIGSELCRQIVLPSSPTTLLLLLITANSTSTAFFRNWSSVAP